MDEDKIVAALLTAGTLAAFGLRGLGNQQYMGTERGLAIYRAYLDALQIERETARAAPTST